MTISDAAWLKYIKALAKISDEAAEKFRKRLEIVGAYNGVDVDTAATWEQLSKITRQALIDYAYNLTETYGTAAGELSCEMYDALAALSGQELPAAEIAATPTIKEVAITVNGTMKTGNPDIMAQSIGRLVKQTSVDTTIKNAIRDGAEIAWVPRGDTCAFCLTLASRGWQPASKKALRNGHAEHIHSNCDCTYAVRFDNETNVQGYDPEEYLGFYEQARGTPEERINAMRRAIYEANKKEINAQKRSAYAKRMERNSSAAEEMNIE